MYEILYQTCNVAVVPAWLLLLFAPQHRATAVVVHSGAASAVFCCVYTVLLIADFGSASEGSFTSLEQLSVLFARPEAALVGWMHYIALDLLVGSWELKDMERSGVPLRWRFLTLPLTLFLAPLGVLVYFGVRALFGRSDGDR